MNRLFFMMLLCVMLCTQIFSANAMQMSGCVDGYAMDVPACHHAQAVDAPHDACCEHEQCVMCVHCSASFTFLVPEIMLTALHRQQIVVDENAPYFYAAIMLHNERPPRMLLYS